MRSPAWALATARPRVSCRCRESSIAGHFARTSPSTRSMRAGAAQPMVSASENTVILAPASAAMASPSSSVRSTCAGLDIALVVAAEGRHHAEAGDGHAALHMQGRLLAHGREVLGMAAVEVLAREGLGCAERDRAADRELAAEGKRPLEPGGVEPQGRVVDAGLGLEAFHHGLGIGPARHQARIDERANLDVAKAGLGQGLDQPDLVGGSDRSGLDLEALARAFLMDVHAGRQVGHSASCARQP